MYIFCSEKVPRLGHETIKMSTRVNLDNQNRTLILKGLSFRTRVDDVVKFFQGHGSITRRDIHMEVLQGRTTGIAAAIFATPDLAHEAWKKYDGQEIDDRGRYVEIFNYK